jgi:hypothetical protein
MRFMMIVKSAENSGAPPKELMDAIAKLSEEGKSDGSLLASGGLAPTAASSRVRLSGGKRDERSGGRVRGDGIQVQTSSAGKRQAVHGTAPEILARVGRGNGSTADFWAGRLHHGHRSDAAET